MVPGGKFLAGAEENGVPLDVAERTFESLAGFAQFGFPKSHAAAFGLLAYQTTSTWLEYYPAEFFCALFNNWPMGFYPPHVHQRRPAARRRGPATRDQRQPGALHRGEHRGAGRGAARACVRPGDGATTAAAVVDERDRRALPVATRLRAPHRSGRGGHRERHPGRGLRRPGPPARLLWQLWLLAWAAGRPSTKRTAGRPRYRQLRLDLPTEQDHVPLAEVSGSGRWPTTTRCSGCRPMPTPCSSCAAGCGAGSGPAASCSTSHRSGRSTPRPGRLPAAAWQRPGAVFLLLEDEHGLVNVMLAPSSTTVAAPRCGAALSCASGRGRGPGRGNVAMLKARTVTPVKPPAALRFPDGKSWG